MIKITNLALPFDHSDIELRKAVIQALRIAEEDLLNWRIKRRSLDARRNRPLRKVYTVIAEVRGEGALAGTVEEDNRLSYWTENRYQSPVVYNPSGWERPLVIGSGPAGLFAGLVLARAGLNPLILERGKPVDLRRVDVMEFWRTGVLNPESNVQFGEGGAGTFSDGKLGSRIKDKFGRREKVLQELVEAGAPQDILINHKPHVGTANLVKVVENIRKKIQNLGGEVRFESRVDDLILENSCLAGVVLASGERLKSSHHILAVGHSARDTFEMMAARGVRIEAKPFSVGLRIEHPQSMIDRNQYGSDAGHPALTAAEYQLSYHTSQGRTVYSFCMCPGGTVIAAASEIGGLVTNGMSQYERNGNNANSAIVAEVFPSDYAHEPLAGLQFQRKWEQIAYQLGGGGYLAPVQLVGDYLRERTQSDIAGIKPTYQPGVRLADLRQALPAHITAALQEGLRNFDKKIAGFAQSEAVLTGIETRTSCPLRIVRRKDFQSVSLPGLYPAGEGSGYAGGIMSSAIDGMKAAEMIVRSYSRSGN